MYPESDSAIIAEISMKGKLSVPLPPMKLPSHIVDLVCSLQEQAVDDNEIIRWCITMLDDPRRASMATTFLETGDRSFADIQEMISGLLSRT